MKIFADKVWRLCLNGHLYECLNRFFWVKYYRTNNWKYRQNEHCLHLFSIARTVVGTGTFNKERLTLTLKFETIIVRTMRDSTWCGRGTAAPPSPRCSRRASAWRAPRRGRGRAAAAAAWCQLCSGHCTSSWSWDQGCERCGWPDPTEHLWGDPWLPGPPCPLPDCVESSQRPGRYTTSPHLLSDSVLDSLNILSRQIHIIIITFLRSKVMLSCSYCLILEDFGHTILYRDKRYSLGNT